MNRVLAIALSAVGVVVSAVAVYGVVRVAARERTDPARCGVSLVSSGPRCCAQGQTFSRKHCSGAPASCPVGMHLAAGGKGCAADEQRVKLAGGKLHVSPDDWEAEGIVLARTETVAPFVIDTTEVTAERWDHCVVAGSCRAVTETEPGQPVTGVDPKEAEHFCRFVNGRLPTSEEWLFAAMGVEGRRFPWGPTGLVCRRSAFGLSEGPCARGGAPELAYARPDGKTPEGVSDLSGNVAEWTVERDGRHVARGGSYRSTSAVELASWAFESVSRAAPWIGFRCVYDLPKAP